VTNVTANAIYPYVNPNALFLGQWDFKKKGLSEEQYEKMLEEKAWPIFKDLQKRAIAEKLLEPKVVYGYFPVQSDGDDLIVYHTEEFDPIKCDCGATHSGPSLKPFRTPREQTRFSFPRPKQHGDGFVSPTSSDRRRRASTTCSACSSSPSGIARPKRLKNCLRPTSTRTTSSSTASASNAPRVWPRCGTSTCARNWASRAKTRRRSPSSSQQGYRGSRYSFGYGACPSLEDRAKIVRLLNPGTIGVTLSENFMLVPEQSTDALVVHHPQAKYFDV
jgi:5-methyltetrahydrofolate--homocysteine methyltransferase